RDPHPHARRWPVRGPKGHSPGPPFLWTVSGCWRTLPGTLRSALRRSAMTRYLVTALAVGLLLAADDAKKDKERLQGSWRPVSGEQGGKAQENAKEHLLTFDGDTFTIKRGDQLFVKGTFTLDPSRTPKAITMKV